ncbi:MAG: hypothetical protein LCH38_10810 [Proteobacteria bacterium]|nr:hypothetical protein [Pseudomonadota bacterium]
MSLPALVYKAGQLALSSKAGQAVFAAEMVGLEVDYTSILKWGFRLTRAATRMHGAARGVDERALAEMVALAQSRASRRTGRLVAGITGTREGEEMVFRATAQRDASSADYAPFVERGTRAGSRRRNVVTAARFDEASGGRRRVSYAHPGTEATPFFYSSAEEILSRRRLEQAEVMARAVAEDQEG